jgi:hypothetical protein
MDNVQRNKIQKFNPVHSITSHLFKIRFNIISQPRLNLPRETYWTTSMGQMDPLYTLPHHFCNKKLTPKLYPNVCLRLQRSLPSIFTVKTVYAFLISPVRATYSAHRTPKSIPTVRCLGHSKESVHVRQQNFVTCCFFMARSS